MPAVEAAGAAALGGVGVSAAAVGLSNSPLIAPDPAAGPASQAAAEALVQAAAGAGVDWAPALRLLALATLVVALPLAIWAWRHRRAGWPGRLQALALLTLFLTFDLVVFGAFTRLTDSGLGCPDWPGCYGQVTPWHAAEDIRAAQEAMPHGPVTTTKAWIEMIHRYLAMAVGALVLLAAVLGSLQRRLLPFRPALLWLTLAWVLLQGAFGAFTVTLRLYPAIVTLHLLGGLVLLLLLARQLAHWQPPAVDAPQRPDARRVWQRLWPWVAALLALQITLGGWVSTNYAVLACRGFPGCNGPWWPANADWGHAFDVLRPLGERGDGGGFLPFGALVAIHWAHRLGAYVLLLAGALLALRLWQDGSRWSARAARLLLGLMLLQLASGLSNVLLGWPLLAALLHTAGAAAWTLVMAWIGWARSAALSTAPPVRPDARSASG